MELITRRTAIGLLAAGTAGLGRMDAQLQAGGRAIRSLAGVWRFQADPENQGVRECWYGQKFSDSLTLPGSLQTNGKTALNTEYSVEGLNPRYVPFTGNVWYQREIEVPASWSRAAGWRWFWNGRPLRESGWMAARQANSKPAGTPHVHEMGESIPPGRHTLVMLAGSELPGRIELVVTTASG